MSTAARLVRLGATDVGRHEVVGTGSGRAEAHVEGERARPGTLLLLIAVRPVRGVGIHEVEILEIRRAEDIAPAFERLRSGVHALYVCGDALTTANSARINTLAMGARLPTIFPDRAFLEAGGFIAYGANNADLFRRAADYVDKILRGTKPADLPVEQPTRFDLAINLLAAKALGLTVPPALLARADEVIE